MTVVPAKLPFFDLVLTERPLLPVRAPPPPPPPFPARLLLRRDSKEDADVLRLNPFTDVRPDIPRVVGILSASGLTTILYIHACAAGLNLLNNGDDGTFPLPDLVEPELKGSSE